MTPRTPPTPPAPHAFDIAELLRQSLAGFAPSDPLTLWLDRLEGRP